MRRPLSRQVVRRKATALRTRGRIQEDLSDTAIRVEIGPRRNAPKVVVGLIAFLGLIFWILMIRALATGRMRLPSGGSLVFRWTWLFLWLGLWLGVVGLGTFDGLLWNVWGRWTIRFADQTLTRTAQLLFIRKSRSFRVSAIANVRLHERRGPRRQVWRSIMFDCAGRAIHLTPWLTRDEAVALLEGPFRELAKGG